MEERPTLIDYLKDFPDDNTHPQVVRFIENLLILLEHEYFAEPEYTEDTAMKCPNCNESMEPIDWLESPITGEMVATGYECENNCAYIEWMDKNGTPKDSDPTESPSDSGSRKGSGGSHE